MGARPSAGQKTGVDSGRCPGKAAIAAPARVTSRDLLNGGTELTILHDGREYRLRITQNGKLILTA